MPNRGGPWEYEQIAIEFIELIATAWIPVRHNQSLGLTVDEWLAAGAAQSFDQPE